MNPNLVANLLADPSSALGIGLASVAGINLHLLALQLMAVQGLLGAFDTLYHHELTETLAQRSSARLELKIHAMRALLYSVLFVGLAFWRWHGVWAALLLLIFTVEIGLTLWDFVTEDQTRLLPASERITHTVLAMNGGAFVALLLINTPAWLAQPSAMVWQSHGWLSMFLALAGVGVALSGLRDGLAWWRFERQAQMMQQALQQPGQQSTQNPGQALHFSERSEQVLVTGGTGFIGQLLVRALLKDGQQVTLLTRQPKQAAWLFDGRIACISDMRELPANRRIDVIINLAGARILGWRWSESRKAQLRASRVKLTASVVEWISRAEHKPRLLLSASAIGYYGIQSAGDATVLTESSPPQAIFMSQLCQEWEVASTQARQHGVQVARMRFGLVLGEQGALPMMLLPIKLFMGGKLGSGQQWLSWIHVQDVLRGMAFLWQQSLGEQGVNGGWNFTSAHTVSQHQFSQIAAKVWQRPCFMPTPGWPMRLMLGEQADLLLEGQRVQPTRLLERGFSFAWPDLHGALASLK
jgi:uncharacterized protein (TIGR01777 family)